MSEIEEPLPMFDHLRNCHIIPVMTSGPNMKFKSEDFEINSKRYLSSVRLILQEFHKKIPMEIKNKKISLWVHDDTELKSETIFLSISDEYKIDFITDLVKLVKYG